MKATRKMNPEKMGTFVPEGRLMTVRETSAMLDLHESTLSHWRQIKEAIQNEGCRG